MIWNVGKLLLLYFWLQVARMVKAISISKCPDNQMYVTILNNGTEHCVHCTICPAGYSIKIACTINSDTVCEQCPTGTYSTGNGRACQTCSQCMPGTYRKYRCNSTMDVECRRCPNGTFSINGNTWRCLPCKFCRPYQNVLKECEPSSNYLCGDCDNDHFIDRATGDCIPCSLCRPGQENVVIPECARKRVHSQSVCMPSNYIPPSKLHLTAEVTVGLHDQNELPDNITVLTIALATIMFSAIIVFLGFILVHCQCVQKCLRFCRDIHVYQMTACSSGNSQKYLENPVTIVNKQSSYLKLYTVFRQFLKQGLRYILCNSGKSGTSINESKCPAILLFEETNTCNNECCKEAVENEVTFEDLSVPCNICLSKGLSCKMDRGVQTQPPFNNDRSMSTSDEQEHAEQVSRISVKPEPSVTSTVVTVHDLPLLESSTSEYTSLEDEACITLRTTNTDNSTIAADKRRSVPDSRRKKRRQSLRTSGSFSDTSIFHTCKYTTL